MALFRLPSTSVAARKSHSRRFLISTDLGVGIGPARSSNAAGDTPKAAASLATFWIPTLRVRAQHPDIFSQDIHDVRVLRRLASAFLFHGLVPVLDTAKVLTQFHEQAVVCLVQALPAIGMGRNVWIDARPERNSRCAALTARAILGVYFFAHLA
jgi:hypothetical protein